MKQAFQEDNQDRDLSSEEGLCQDETQVIAQSLPEIQQGDKCYLI